MKKRVVRLNESELTRLVERIVKKVNEKPLRESRNRRRVINEGANDLLKRLKSMFPNLEAFIEGDLVCVVLSHHSDEEEPNLLFKRGVVIRDEGSDVYGIGDYSEALEDGVSVEMDMDINSEDNFDGVVSDIRKGTTNGGKPYKS
jgi:hypothetical protein